MGSGFALGWGAALVVALVAYFALPATVLTFGMAAVALGCGAAVLVRAGRLRTDPVWWLVGAALASSGLGEVVWGTYELRGADPFPSLADPLYLLAYPLWGLAMVQLVRRFVPRADRAGLLDAAIVAAGAGALAWVVLGAPYVARGGSAATVGVAVAYPCADVLLLGFLVRLSLAAGLHAPTVRLFTAGVAAMLVADLGFVRLDLTGGYETGHLIDAGWVVSYVLLAAAWHRSAVRAPGEALPAVVGDPHPVDLHPSRLALLGPAVLMAPTVLVVQAARDHDADLFGLAVVTAVLLVLVVARMVGLIHRLRAHAVSLALLGDTDQLTALPNRRVWDRELDRSVALARQCGLPLAVAILDMDHFKGVNDTRGHAAGDRILAEVAAAWRGRLRPEDLLARYGGEEFALLLPGLDGPAALGAAERLRVACPDGQTCSVGLAMLAPADTGADVLARADAALYDAKRSGRDRTVLAPAPVADLADYRRPSADRRRAAR